MMDEQRGLYLSGLALSNEERIATELAIRDLWLIVSALQLVVAQDGLHTPLKTLCEGVGRELQALIGSRLPEVVELMEMGWQREYDYVEYDDDDPDWDPDDDDLTDRSYGHYGFP